MAVGLPPARLLLVQSLFPSIYKGLCGHTAGESRVEAAGHLGRGGRFPGGGLLRLPAAREPAKNRHELPHTHSENHPLDAPDTAFTRAGP